MKNKGFCLSAIALIFCMCASQGMPPGGPVDKSAPVLVDTFPEPGSTNVSREIQVSFFFDEAINTQKANDNIFITPYQGENVQYRWRGKRLDIRFLKPLRENRTYVITLGTGLRDYQGNAIDTSKTLAFSTGDHLDTGEIKGRVFGVSDAKGIDVWAYLIQDSVQVNPGQQEPEYVVQCSENGSFHFQYLASGSYRLFGIKDRVADRLYQPMEDDVGIASHDIFLNDSIFSVVDSVYFKMTKEDTLRPTLLQSSAFHQKMVMLRFDEPVQPVNNRTVQIIRSGNDGDPLKIDDFYINPKSSNTIFCEIAPLDPKASYQVLIDSLFDFAGNAFDTTLQVNHFDGTAAQDTSAPKLMEILPAPGALNVPLSQRIRIVFNEPLDTASIDSAFVFSDTSGTSIPGGLLWENAAVIDFSPEIPLLSSTDYRVKIQPNAGFDLYGNAVPDTLIQFKTLNKDTLSEVSGELLDPTESAGPYRMKLFQIQKPEISYSIQLNQTGEYTFKNILPGTYFIEVFEDVDLNDLYTPGAPCPWKPSERYIQMSDTIKVRSRWTNEGNRIQMPK